MEPLISGAVAVLCPLIRLDCGAGVPSAVSSCQAQLQCGIEILRPSLAIRGFVWASLEECVSGDCED